ncbi:hypothetical protein NDU88_008284 [Pleurodeles waltl]|uniref:Uncharacterized protein n=1 Tax=Pleurodeles waltl TaxID=8319 RepID=A0AAV7RX97_PLEWA|nr:hypothetical protein NDU88_008284 [Pleurodeles waltl]
MPQSGSPRDSHLPRCSWAILHVLCPGARHASPKLRGQRSVRAVGHHGHDHPTGGPSIRRSSRSAGGPVLSSFRAALLGPGPFRRCVPVFKVGLRYTRGPLRQTHVPHAGSAPQQGSRQPGPTLGPRAPVAHVLVASPYLRGWGPARTPGRRHTVLRGLGNMRLSTISPAATSRQEGGHPASPAAIGRLPLKRRTVPRPAARPLTRSVRLPALTRRQAPGRGARRPSPTGPARLALGSAGARVTHTGPRSRSPSICPGGWPRITGEV